MYIHPTLFSMKQSSAEVSKAVSVTLKINEDNEINLMRKIMIQNETFEAKSISGISFMHNVSMWLFDSGAFFDTISFSGREHLS